MWALRGVKIIKYVHAHLPVESLNDIGNELTPLFSGVIMETKRTCSQDYIILEGLMC